MATQDHYAFQDPSGLIIHVQHVSRTHGVSDAESDRKKFTHQQPCSQISVEVPQNCAIDPKEMYTKLFQEAPPENFQLEEGNCLPVGEVNSMIAQIRLSQAMIDSGLFAEDTILAMHQCCNNPTPAKGSAVATR